MRKIILVSIMVVFFIGVQGVGLHGDDAQGIRDEAGFVTIEPVEFSFHYNSHFNRLPLKSTTARIWYSFQTADREASSKPLFIFFNGGPGSGTSEGLMSLNTGRLAYCTDSENERTYIDNPHSWTQLGNLLWVDARQTGFSYSIMPQHDNTDARYRAFGGQNHNCFFDAADFIRLLLRFLADHPSIRNNPVVIVGESYGGIRTIAMLHMLLNYRDYGKGGGAVYRDEALVEEIQAHYDRVYLQYSGTEVPAAIIAGQFRHQVLIQPAITMNYQSAVIAQMWEQEDSVIFKLAEELGVEYIPCSEKPTPCNPRRNAYAFVESQNRDLYMYAKPANWTGNFFYEAGEALKTTANLSQLTGVDARQIEDMYATARQNAFRVAIEEEAAALAGMDMAKLPEPERWLMEAQMRLNTKSEHAATGDLEAVFGTLNPWDLYFRKSYRRVQYAFYINIATHMGYEVGPYATLMGEMFLKNAAHVETFITNAAYDLVIYSPAIPPALGMHTGIIDTSRHQTTPVGNEERPGRIILNYRNGAFPDIPELRTRTIRFPVYPESCHCVPLTEPAQIFGDVAAWLTETRGTETNKRGE
ncbi:MAG: S10 family peptidase [bacterium]|nr:S10 family peptidase [bacterium]